MSYGVRVGSHIGVDALVRALGPRSARVLGAVAALCCVVYALIVLVGSWRYVSTMHMLGTLAQDVPIPVWIPQLVLPLGFALLALQGVSELIKRIAVMRSLIPDPHATQVHALEAEVEHLVEAIKKH